MAIASVILKVTQAKLDAVEATLTNMRECVELQRLHSVNVESGFAVVLECQGAKLAHLLEHLEQLPDVEELNLIFANYEDDLEAEASKAGTKSEGKRL
ncbi:MAG: hypothetical protein IJU79_07525 [Desulfovibrionaceae bacterium]|nr:hypothetical protein [Desulfovibrionaceae bacterium]